MTVPAPAALLTRSLPPSARAARSCCPGRSPAACRRVEPAAVVAHEQTPALAVLEHHLDCRGRGVLDGVSDRLASDVHERVERRLVGLGPWGTASAAKLRGTRLAAARAAAATVATPGCGRVPAGRRPCCERAASARSQAATTMAACAACAGSSASMRAVASASDRSCMIRSWTSAAVRRRSTFQEIRHRRVRRHCVVGARGARARSPATCCLQREPAGSRV